MAFRCNNSIATLFFVLALAAGFQISLCQVVKGKVSCLDCNLHDDLSGIKVAVKCDKEQKLATGTTRANGDFETELPAPAPNSQPVNCLAKVMGGTSQTYSRKKDMVSKVVDGPAGSNSYTISTPLALYTSCPSADSCKASNQLGSSKTVDLPLPREWGLAPSSYYVPFFPIIGIP